MALCRSCNQACRYWQWCADHTSVVAPRHIHSPFHQTTPFSLSGLTYTYLWEGLFPCLMRRRGNNIGETKSTNNSVVFKYSCSVGGRNRAKSLSYSTYTYSWTYWFILWVFGEYTGLYLLSITSNKPVFESGSSFDAFSCTSSLLRCISWNDSFVAFVLKATLNKNYWKL